MQDNELVSIQKFYSGPLPPPSDLEHYKRIYPDAVEMIFEMAKNDQAHAIKMDTLEIGVAKLNVILSALIGFTGQLGTILITLSGFILAYLRPELGKWGIAYSAVICGYLIWWKTKKSDNQQKDD